jgi:hypothetical protein
MPEKNRHEKRVRSALARRSLQVVTKGAFGGSKFDTAQAKMRKHK